MLVLGISALYHDSAAAICKDGHIIAAAQEERFTRIKHDLRLPIHAINYCLETAGAAMEDLDQVVYYDNPLLTLDRLMKNVLALGERSGFLISERVPSLLQNKLWIQDHLRNVYGKLGKEDALWMTEHHISHAASAYYPSPFPEAAILTIDGVGEWATTTIGLGRGNELKILKQLHYPHSLGLLYSAFTYFCGFKVNSGDYKFMGLAPYGEPVYEQVIKDHLIRIQPDGSFWINMEYFDFHQKDVMTNEKFAALFGGPPREPESRITKREMDIAASAQKVTEEVILLLAKHAKEITGMKYLVMAGGVALNCVANGRLLKEKLFEDIWIQPAAGDAGGALGCALYAEYEGNQSLDHTQTTRQGGSYLGPEFSREDIKEYLDSHGFAYHEIEGRDQLYDLIAQKIADQNVIGLFHGRMEYGPRALGNRSIIADARAVDMQARMNLKIKYRESFRPFAPSVLEEDVSEYFELDQKSPYMLLVANVKKELRDSFEAKESLESSGYDMLKVVNRKRSVIPAVTHVDYSARIQTVSETENPYYYGVLNAFKKKTGCSVIVNTSFNVRGEPIVCTPEDAYRCFMRTEMDILVLENMILYKSEQNPLRDDADWRKEFVLD